MSTTAVDLHSPASGGFRHELMLHAGPEQFVRCAVRFAREAIENGDSVIFAFLDPLRSLVQAELGPDVEHVEFPDTQALARNPARIIPAWREWVAQHHDAGRGICGISQPVITRSPDAIVEYQIHELLLQAAFGPGPQWRMLCPYDTKALPGSLIAKAEEAHGVGPFGDAGSDGVPGAIRERPDAAFTALSAAFGSALPELDRAQLLYVREFGLAELGEVREAAQLCAGLLDGGRTADLALVIGELAANSIIHGGGRGTVSLWHDEDDVVCDVRDLGLVKDPLIGRRRPDTRIPGGAGLWIANQVCDLVQIRSAAESGTQVRVRMSQTGAAAA